MALFNKKSSDAVLPSLGPLELDILKLIWEKQTGTVKSVQIVLNQDRSKKEKLAYTTVMTILKRLVDKKVLMRVKDGRSFNYQPCKPSCDFVSEVVKQRVQELVNVYGDNAVTALKQQLQSL